MRIATARLDDDTIGKKKKSKSVVDNVSRELPAPAANDGVAVAAISVIALGDDDAANGAAVGGPAVAAATADAANGVAVGPVAAEATNNASNGVAVGPVVALSSPSLEESCSAVAVDRRLSNNVRLVSAAKGADANGAAVGATDAVNGAAVGVTAVDDDAADGASTTSSTGGKNQNEDGCDPSSCALAANLKHGGHEHSPSHPVEQTYK